MYEEKNAKGEEREVYVEELVAEFKRRELNEIARSLGLNPDDYPNKRTIADAILEAREMEEAPIEGEVTSPPPEEETLEKIVEEEVEIVNPNTVRGKMKAASEKAAEFNDYASALLEIGQDELRKGVATFNRSVQEQIKNYEKYIKKEFTEGIRAFHKSVKAFQQSIREQVNENQDYVKRFYG